MVWDIRVFVTPPPFTPQENIVKTATEIAYVHVLVYGALGVLWPFVSFMRETRADRPGVGKMLLSLGIGGFICWISAMAAFMFLMTVFPIFDEPLPSRFITNYVRPALEPLLTYVLPAPFLPLALAIPLALFTERVLLRKKTGSLVLKCSIFTASLFGLIGLFKMHWG